MALGFQAESSAERFLQDMTDTTGLQVGRMLRDITIDHGKLGEGESFLPHKLYDDAYKLVRIVKQASDPVKQGKFVGHIRKLTAKECGSRYSSVTGVVFFLTPKIITHAFVLWVIDDSGWVWRRWIKK